MQQDHHQNQQSYGSIIDLIPQNDSSVTEVKSNNINQRYQIGLLIFGTTLLLITVLSLYPAIASTSLSMIMMDISTAMTKTNPLIDIMQSSSTIIHPQSYYKSNVDEYPSLYIDLEHERQVYNGHTTNEETTLSMSWTDGQFHSTTTPILNKNSNTKNIVALQCGDSDSHLYFVDAVTLSDATESSGDGHNRQQRRRSLTETGWYGSKDFDWWGGSGTLREKTWHNNNDDTYESHKKHSGNEWFIASVPQYILDYRKCQAIMYYYIRDGEYVLISKSTIIHL